MHKKVSIFWFRRDLRLDDNVAFLKALKGDFPVLCLFIFDTEILTELPKDDARVSFIHKTLQDMSSQLRKNQGSSIALYQGSPVTIFKQLINEYAIQKVFANHDYEPYALKRDSEIKSVLKSHSIDFKSYKDQVIFEKNEGVKADGNPYVVYTPYKNRWKEKFKPDEHLKPHTTNQYLKNILKDDNLPNLSLSDIGFTKASINVTPYKVTPSLIANYAKTRDFPAKDNGTSHLGPHLRFGTVSVRKIMKKAIAAKNEIFWNELIWREFFMQILWHFPHTVQNSFRPKYDRIEWRNDKKEFKKWKNGQTGYALVDAGMRELNQTGYMHNRVRMLTASFLCKHLLIDWRWGEAYFAEKLLDYEMSSNVGNWQWAAGTGVDAAPYFRIFNPMTQVAKFDKQKEYINKWVPELQELTYPEKMVDHKMARERCLKAYKLALN